MTFVLTPGTNAPLSSDIKTLTVTLSSTQASVDLLVMALDDADKADGDNGVALWTQPECQNGAVKIDVPTNKATVDLKALPEATTRLLFVAQADGVDTVAQCGTVQAVVSAGSDTILWKVDSPGSVPTLQVGEIYRHGGGWKVRCLGDGYADGIVKLLAVHGIDVDDEPSAPAQDSPVPALNMTKGEEKLPLDMRKKLSMRKAVVAKVLMEKKAPAARARVIIAMDCSSSMRNKGLYPEVMRNTIEKVAAAAATLDDDGSLDAWRFGNRSEQVPSLTIADMPNWLELYVGMDNRLREIHEYKSRQGETIPPLKMVGYGNDEAAVISDIRKFVKDNPSSDPTLVLFFSDGGVVKDHAIEQEIKGATTEPIFWQFVGLGSKAGYGILERLDTMTGRSIDNVGFFSIDDIDTKADEELYTLLLSEFPEWLVEAKRQGVIS